MIDDSAEQIDALVSNVVGGARVLMLDAEKDSIEQITQAVDRNFTQSIHVFTHSAPGCLHFSSGDLTIENLHYYAEQIESWFRYCPFYKGSSMQVQSNDCSLSLYAPNLAEGSEGKTFIESLHHLAGVNVHASAKAVGCSAIDNCWQLEVSYPFPQTIQMPFAP